MPTPRLPAHRSSKSVPPAQSPKSSPVSPSPKEVPLSPVQQAQKAREEARLHLEAPEQPTPEARISQALARFDNQTLAVGSGLLACGLLAALQVWLTHPHGSDPVPSPKPSPPKKARMQPKVPTPKVAPPRPNMQSQRAPNPWAGYDNPKLPGYPGSTIRLIHDSSEDGEDSLQMMASSQDPPKKVIAWYCAQAPALRVRSLGVGQHPIWKLDGRRGDRLLHLTITRGAGEDGTRTVITLVSDRAQGVPHPPAGEP